MEKSKPKVLPGLGGASKYYLRKNKILEISLKYLSNKLNDVIASPNLNDIEKDLLIKNKKDIIQISKFERKNKIEFYNECLDIINKY